MRDAILLTLGHNSSAILVRDGEIVCGYENERLTHKKSDSSFPLEAIVQIKKFYNVDPKAQVFISHWFTDLSKPLDKQGKWYDDSAMKALFPYSGIYTLSIDFTHHDAHAWSAKCFVDDSMPADTYTIVADGFGSYGETMSIYGPGMRLVHRSFGFNTSLGLLYQYATSFLGLKENQDEYKLLGYEAHIDSILLSEAQRRIMEDLIESAADGMFMEIMVPKLNPEFDPVVSISALPAMKDALRDGMRRWLNIIGCGESQYNQRVIIAYMVQSVLERVMVGIIRKFGIGNVVLVGGIFLNVKLNNVISKTISKDGNPLKGWTSIMPLSGDQGAAIGLYHSLVGVKWPHHLYWGRRDFSDLEPYGSLHVLEKDDPNPIIEALEDDMIVNVVRGSMEYGSRALCHTSTLALPDPDNVEYINDLNGRDTIMPMAPVLTEDRADALFNDKNRVHQSLEYMVCARDCKTDLPESMFGITHVTPNSSIRTCRPQIIRHDPFMEAIIDQTGPLINTSFNEHGKPIVYNTDDVVRCHDFQVEHDYLGRVITFAIKEQA